MAELPHPPEQRILSLSEIAQAVREDALEVFGDRNCKQETSDAIEYFYGALCAIQARRDFWDKS